MSPDDPALYRPFYEVEQAIREAIMALIDDRLIVSVDGYLRLPPAVGARG